MAGYARGWSRKKDRGDCCSHEGPHPLACHLPSGVAGTSELVHLSPCLQICSSASVPSSASRCHRLVAQAIHLGVSCPASLLPSPPTSSPLATLVSQLELFWTASLHLLTSFYSTSSYQLQRHPGGTSHFFFKLFFLAQEFSKWGPLAQEQHHPPGSVRNAYSSASPRPIASESPGMEPSRGV